MSSRVIVGVAILTFAPSAFAAGLAYVRATSQLQGDTQRGRFHPLNLLDDDPSTSWCEGAPGLGESEGVHISFKKPQRIDRVLINPSPATGRLVETVRITDGTTTIRIPIGESGGVQVLSRPLEGTTYEIMIDRVGTASGEGDPEVACIGDALLYLGNALFGGGATKLRYDERLDKLLGRWNGGALGAPEKSLLFALDGTWEWTFRPLLGGKQRRMAGEYRFRGNRLLMREGEVGRWADTQFKYQRVKIDPEDMQAPSGDYDRLSFGPALGADFAGEYDNAQF